MHRYRRRLRVSMRCGIDYELRKFHYDVALQANRLRLRRSLPTSQHRRFLLGSDFLFGTSADDIRGLEEYGLKPSDLDAIYHGNAERPLPQLKV